MSKTDRPLNDDEREEVAACAGGALKWLGEGETGASPDHIQVRLRETIDLFRSLNEADRAAHIQKAALCLGCLWGQAVCDQLGWKWAVVSLEPDQEYYGVVSPSRSHMIFPLHYVRGLLADPEKDQTSLLLYNMLKAGSLPPAEPGSYQVLG